jgi:nitrogen fixation/metabolism regulation signal transduction histidine kinase
MGYFLYQTVANATDQLLAQKLGDLNLTKEAIDAFMTQSEKDKMITLWTLIGAMFLLVLLLSGVTIALTHRVAGPIYKMRKIFGAINGSDLRLWDKLRRGDELQEAFEDFEAMLRRLREDRRNDIAALEDIRRTLEKSGGNEETVQNLRNIVERYRSSVKMD